MNVVLKWSMPIAGGAHSLVLPEDAEFLSWGTQDPEYLTSVSLWFETDARYLDPEFGRRIERWFRIVGTGHPEIVAGSRYLGTQILNKAGLVLHLYEVIQGE